MFPALGCVAALAQLSCVSRVLAEFYGLFYWSTLVSLFFRDSLSVLLPWVRENPLFHFYRCLLISYQVWSHHYSIVVNGECWFPEWFRGDWEGWSSKHSIIPHFQKTFSLAPQETSVEVVWHGSRCTGIWCLPPIHCGASCMTVTDKASTDCEKRCFLFFNSH